MSTTSNGYVKEDMTILDTSIQDQINKRVYHSPGIDRAYYHADELEIAEVVAFLKYQPAIAGSDVLDIGVGAGRTTPYLMQLAKSYVGIDYSPIMVECFKRKYPDVSIFNADMRDLSFLTAESIDFALASCNVIDAVSHEDRLKVLAQIHRVMRPNAILIFSAHNRSFHSVFRGPRLRRSYNLCTQALHVLRFVRQQINHSRTGKLRRVERDYALLDDIGHDYRLLHYYVSRTVQTQQLAQCGFRTLDVYTDSGSMLSAGDEGTDSAVLHYVALKLPSEASK